MGRSLYGRWDSDPGQLQETGQLLGARPAGGYSAQQKEANAKFIDMLQEDAFRKDRMSMGDDKGWRVALSIEGTILPVLLAEPLFILCLVSFAVLRTLALMGILETDISVEFRGTSMLGNAVSFFLVFYSAQTFSRFREQYLHAMDAGGAIHGFAMQARASLSRERGMRLVRQLNAAQMLAYMALEEDCDQDFLKRFNAVYHILTAGEMETVLAMDTKGSSPMATMIQWVLDEVSDGLKAGDMSELRAERLNGKAMEAKTHLARLFHYAHQQVPFAYVHLATLLSYVYLPLLSVTLAMAPTNHAEILLWEIQNAVALVFTCAFVLGLRETARIMSDPFGNDDYDLPAITFGLTTMKKCNEIMSLRSRDTPLAGGEPGMAAPGYGAC